jgi:hypothetical protein
MIEVVVISAYDSRLFGKPSCSTTASPLQVLLSISIKVHPNHKILNTPHPRTWRWYCIADSVASIGWCPHQGSRIAHRMDVAWDHKHSSLILILREVPQQFRHFEMSLISHSTQCLNSGKYLQKLILRPLLHSVPGSGSEALPCIYKQAYDSVISVWGVCNQSPLFLVAAVRVET